MITTMFVTVALAIGIATALTAGRRVDIELLDVDLDAWL